MKPRAAAHWLHQTRLADGRAVLIRRASAADAAYIQRFVTGASSRSRYERYFAPLRELNQAMLERVTQPDEERGAALLAFAAGSQPEVVGMAQYEVIDSGEAEAAVMVAEGWRRVGLAAALLSDLAVIMDAAGVAQVRADILRGNGAALALAQQVGCVVDTRLRDAYAVHVVKHVASPSKHIGSAERRAAN